MSDRKLIVGPFNRVEGDLEIRLDISENKVAAAYANSPLFRGIERILLGKDPRDAMTIAPRICGICSISQSVAAARALGSAAGIRATPEAEKVTMLLHAVENMSDHLTHFHLFFMPDFARSCYAGRQWHDRVTARFTAMQGSAARRAVEARASLLHIVGMLAGKWPHTLAIQPGGVTRAPSRRDLLRIQTSLRAFRRFMEEELFGGVLEDFADLSDTNALMNWSHGDAGLFLEIATDLDLASVGKGPGRYMSFGAYPGLDKPLFARGTWHAGRHGTLDGDNITEDLSHAWMLGETAHPDRGTTLPDENMSEPGYSWCKAPRLAGQVMETGAFARQLIDAHPLAQDLVAQGGVLARVAGRLLELARTQIAIEKLVADINPESRFMDSFNLPEQGEGAGLVEAARGALGHWVRIENGVIASYQIIAPTTWNFSPRDALGNPGAVEAALVGAAAPEGEDTPVMVQHIVRSFDPCMVCTVH